MARLVSLHKIVDDGRHNSMTDMIRWSPSGDRDARYFLVYRSGERHETYPPGVIVVLASSDAENWTEVARLTTGLDDRDPKLVDDGQRLLLFFGSHEEERRPTGERVPGSPRLTYTHVSSSPDGENWETPVRVFGPSWWLWAPKRFDDGFWSTAYGMDLDGSSVEVILAHSEDGTRWQRHATLLPGRPGLAGSEGALHRFDDGRMLAVVRGAEDETFLFEARSPFTSWRRSVLPHWIHAPVLAPGKEQLIVAGRDRDGSGGYVTRLWSLSNGRSTKLLDLPSGGDTSYCGLAREPDGSLLVSYYSQHEFLNRPGFEICEKPSAIYVARVAL